MSQVQRVEPNTQLAPAGGSAEILSVIMKVAADPQCDMEKMERLLQMHERMQAHQAQVQFSADLAAMQCDIPSIAERGKGHGSIRYATLEDINDVVKPIMQRFGFAMSFKVEHHQGGINVTGILMHKAGHREETTILLPSDTSGSKNAVQAVASSVSYGKRYVMCAMLNITTRGEDDDGNAAAPVKTVTAAQASQLSRVLAKCSEKAQQAFEAMHGTADQVPTSEFDHVLAALNNSASKNQG